MKRKTGYSRIQITGREPETKRCKLQDKQRNPFYSTKKWQALSELVRRTEPFCTLCLCFNKFVFSECVDHLDGDTKNNKRDNLCALCFSCHNYKTNQSEKSDKLSKVVVPDDWKLPIKPETIKQISNNDQLLRITTNDLFIALVYTAERHMNTDYSWLPNGK